MKIDNLGRIVIPKIMRDKLGLSKNDELDIMLDGDRIIISKTKDELIERIQDELNEAKTYRDNAKTLDEKNFYVGYVNALKWLLEEKSELNN